MIPRIRINRYIRVSPVHLIGADGEPVGVVPLDQAQRMANDAGLDLVEVSPTNRPPICKILDYGKWKYDMAKKKKESKANTQKVELKEIRVGFRTGDHDLQVRAKQAEKFLKEGNKVKINLLFRGREMDYFAMARAKLIEFAKGLEEFGILEIEPKKMGRSLSLILRPIKKSKKN